MNDLQYTLLSDGSSDQALIPILNWLLKLHFNNFAINSNWADLRKLPRPPKTLSDRIKVTLELFPCDLLFIHRDAEKQTIKDRISEIQNALTELNDSPGVEMPQYICVVPVKMLEAWLLIDENAIRRASGNPNGRIKLQIPPNIKLEKMTDPKSSLHDLIKSASELKGRKLKSFNVNHAAVLVSTFIRDYSPLRQLPAFAFLEKEITRIKEFPAN
jgi:hypothetical protein